MNSLANLQDLSGRLAVVTGGAGLLGGEIADVLAELGADIVIASRNIESCRKKIAGLSKSYKSQKFYATKVDISDSNSVVSGIEDITSNIGDIDVLVVCAWSGRKNDWDTITEDDWSYDIDVCLTGVFRLIKASTQSLESTQGVVLTIGSMYGHVAPDYRLYENVPQANPPSYGAAKAGVIQLTKYLASFLSEKKIRVNCLSPGAFPFESIVDEYPEFHERLCNKNPLNRTGSPSEIKGAVALLCTDASSYMTGQNICVDGGWSIW